MYGAFALSFMLGVALAATPGDAHAADVLQFGYDPAHSGHNTQEHGYPVAAAAAAQWHVDVHASGSTTKIASDSTPAYLSRVATASATQDLLFLVTKNGTVVAFAASNGAVVWSHQPTPATGSSLTTGAPAIDPNRLYVYAYGLDGYVHKYQVGDGAEIVDGGWPQLSTLKPAVEKGASALSFASPSGGIDYLYVPTNGYSGDLGDYQGHVTIVNLATGAQNIFNTQCSNVFVHFVNYGTPRVDDCDLKGQGSNRTDGQMSGIWGRPGVTYDAATNRIYFATGNGMFDANLAGGYEWGDSVLALAPDGSGAGMGMPLDSFTPSSFSTLYSFDNDLGSTSPALLPSTSSKYPHLAVQSGKDGCVRLLDLDDLSGAGGPGHVGGEINQASSCSTDAVSGPVRTQPAVWVNPADATTWFYIANYSGLSAFHLLIDAAGEPSLSVWSTPQGGTSPVIANGVLYYAAGSTLVAVDALSGTPLWSAAIGAIKWQSPIVVNGHLYITDNDARLWAFALDGMFRNGFQ
jgi:outer membrane protein assembly factor BamB